METKVSSKGQVVLPKSLRHDLHWTAGTSLTVERHEDAVVLRRKQALRPTTLDEVAGCLRYDGRPVTVSDMERGIDEAIQERWERKRL